MLGWEGTLPVSALIQFLQSEMETRGWSEQRLAQAARLNRSIVAAILSGRTPVPTLESLDALAHALDRPLAHLITLCGFALERDAGDRTINEQVSLLLESVPELRPLFGDLTRLSLEDLRVVRAHIQEVLQRKQQVG